MQGVHPAQRADHEPYYVERTWVPSDPPPQRVPKVPPTLEEYCAGEAVRGARLSGEFEAWLAARVAS